MPNVFVALSLWQFNKLLKSSLLGYKIANVKGGHFVHKDSKAGLTAELLIKPSLDSESLVPLCFTSHVNVYIF